jgi:hypothetical protein
VRGVLVCVAVLGFAGACDAPKGEPGKNPSSAGVPGVDPNTFRASANIERPYAGEWAAEAKLCGDKKKTWTIEPHRMAIVPAMRFCAFDNVYVNEGSDGAPDTWSASAKCLAQGHETHDFLFFRVQDNLHEMRVTFNDSKSVDLVRCPMKS